MNAHPAPDHDGAGIPASFEASRAQLIDLIAAGDSVLPLAWSLSQDFGLAVTSEQFMKVFGVKPVLAVVERKSDRMPYFKQFDPFTGLEAHGAIIFEDEAAARLAQFPEALLVGLDHELRRIDNREHHRPWRYLRLARPADFSTVVSAPVRQ